MEERPGPVRFLPGIEIDCVFEGTDMHLLGLGIDVDSHDLIDHERRMTELYYGVFDRMLENIRLCGFPADRELIAGIAGNKPPVGEMIIEAMLTNENRSCELLRPYYPGGDRADMPYLNFYFDWFAQGRPAYVPVEFMDFSQAVDMVVSNGGIPIVAHPGQNFRGREQVAERLLATGAAGIECFNNYHTPAQARYFAELAVRHDAIMTLGSDFHGKVKPLIRIGTVSTADVAVEYSAYLDHSVEKLAAGSLR